MLKKLLFLGLVLFGNSLILGAGKSERPEISAEAQDYIKQIDELLLREHLSLRDVPASLLENIVKGANQRDYKLIKEILEYYTKGKKIKINDIKNFLTFLISIFVAEERNEYTDTYVPYLSFWVFPDVFNIAVSYGLDLDLLKILLESGFYGNVGAHETLTRLYKQVYKQLKPKAASSSSSSSTTVPSSSVAKASPETSVSSKDIRTPESRSDLPFAPGGPVSSTSVPMLST